MKNFNLSETSELAISISHSIIAQRTICYWFFSQDILKLSENIGFELHNQVLSHARNL